MFGNRKADSTGNAVESAFWLSDRSATNNQQHDEDQKMTTGFTPNLGMWNPDYGLGGGYDDLNDLDADELQDIAEDPMNYPQFNPKVYPSMVYPTDAMWQERGGRQTPLPQLEERHLLNIYRAVRAGTAQATPYMRVALGAEITRRGLTPLPDYESKDEALAVSAVSALYTYWKRIPADRRSHAITVVEVFLTGHENDTVGQFLKDPSNDDRTSDEKTCISAMLRFAHHVDACSTAATMRCYEVFKRWATAMHIDDELGSVLP